jgi:hypothetical protein
MANLKNRIQNLKNRTSDIAVRQVCESVLELTDHVPDRNLSALIRERLRELDSQDAYAQRFLVTEKRMARLNDMGISRALERIRLTGVWEHNPQIQYITEWYEKNQLMKTPDFLISEQFIAQMSPFCYDPSINEAIKVVSDIQGVLAEDIAVSKTIHILESSRASKFYSPLVENLKDYLENKSTAMRSAVIAEMETYAYEPVVRELQNKLKEFEANSNKSKFHITGTSADCTVAPVYSFVLVERNADYFAVDGNFFKKSGENVQEITRDAMSRINERFVELNDILNEEQVAVNHNSVTYSYGNNTMIINTIDRTITYNGKPLKIQEVNNKLVEAGIFRWNQKDDLNKFNSIYEHLDTLCEIDFAKRISSKNHSGVQATIMRLGGSITLVKKNPYMNENKVYSGMNGTQARNTIIEFLNYDISESLVEFLSTENRFISQIENERRSILNQIEECEINIAKIEEAQQDILISGSDEISAIKRELYFEIDRLKEKYSQKTIELNNFKTYEVQDQSDMDMQGSNMDMGLDMSVEMGMEEYGKSSKKGKGTTAYTQQAPSRDYGVGDLVTIDGEDGRIIGVDSVQNKATILLLSGDSIVTGFEDIQMKVEESYLYEGKKSKGSKGTSTFTQKTPERTFSIGDEVDVADKGVGKITGIDSAEKTATVLFTGGVQSKVSFPEMRMASDEEVEDEEMYADEMEEYEDSKKKGTSTYIQKMPEKPFTVGDTVNVLGKGIAKITAIDSIRHIAIVILQNGQQSEEEFSNLRSLEEEMADNREENYALGVEMGAEPNPMEQPLESVNVREIDDMDILDIDDDIDYVDSEPTMRDIEISQKLSSVSKGYKKYLDDSFVKEPYRYSPEEDNADWDPEYSPNDSNPTRFMDNELEDEYKITKDEVEATPSMKSEYGNSKFNSYNDKTEFKVSSKDALNAKEKDSDYVFYDDEMITPNSELPKSKNVDGKVKAMVDDTYEDDYLAGEEVLVDEDGYYNADIDEAVEIEMNGVFDFVPKRSINILRY